MSTEHPAVEAQIAAAQRAWPQLRFAPLLFAHQLRQRPPGAAFHPDLYLLGACLHGEPAALTALQHLIQAELATPGLHLRAETRRELEASLLEHLLLASGTAPPRLAAYDGSESLQRWLQPIVFRFALRGRRPDVPRPDSRLDVVSEPPTPEQALLKATGLAQFELAFREAFRSLEARSRSTLRLHYLEGLSLPQVAALYHVHRATAARWIAEARATLESSTRALLAERIGGQSLEVDSLLRLIRTQLDNALNRDLSQ